MTVEQLIREYLAGPGARLKSHREVERVLHGYAVPALGERAVEAIEYGDIAALMRELSERPVQANRVLAHLSTVFTWAVRWKLRSDNPCTWVQRYPEQARVRSLDEGERQRLIEALSVEPDRECAVLLGLLYYTGARVSEVVRLRWERIRGERAWVGGGKNGDERVVYLPGEAQKWLAGLQSEPVQVAGPVFGSGAARRSERVWGRVRARAGLGDLRRHDLRHCFASAGLSAGLTLAQVGALLGHRSVSSTKRYAHLADSEGGALVEKVAGRL